MNVSVPATKKIREWTALAILGFEALSRRQTDFAARHWLMADAEWSADASFDPVLAASRSNAAIAHLLLDRPHEAECRFDEAEHAWRRVIGAIATLDVPMTGASSSFHFLLAAKTPEPLIDARRRHYRRRAEVALAITRFNRLFVDHSVRNAGFFEKRADELKHALGGILGSAAPEIRLLEAMTGAEAASVSAVYGDKVSEVMAQRQTFVAALSVDCANLERALMLTALLTLPIYSSTRLAEDQAKDHSFAIGANQSLNDV